MYFIYPSRVLRQLDRALALFADLEWVKLTQIDQCDQNRIYIADVHDFLAQSWECPTVVIACESEGSALSQAWQKGALAGWIWEDLPEQPYEELQKIEAQYKRNQDSRDLPAAAELQHCLLPKPIDLKNYQLKTLFKPSAYLSGDWYDYWWVDSEHLLFYLADVSGHGVTSSLLTSWMAAFHKRAHSPRYLIEKLNSMLIKENIEKHITMIAGMLNVKANTVTCCNAGHFPPLTILHPDQEPQIVNSNSFPLGLTDDIQVEEFYFDLPKNSHLIICSDGALEPFQGGLNEQFTQLIDRLKQSQFHTPEHVNDDIAIFSLKRII
ncbi:SpoIIE family protein phosphatase [Acinetobacter qingfengensis]|uniref:Stage II sporulation protein E n=1 Tax=Acinetobacter qingfengensis TaxID=1262585 RepID=A0A1E7RFM4_9GAMM|nr:SpoIIE family protein phosphatase [Acinetobacter qingfengensis]KAA8731922.1 SpoIIE family protein phosphatase [Acinetobacter qingfengensis]OEY97955.1 stage II sporulation protein E [Acinetobacter qingfengensis]